MYATATNIVINTYTFNMQNHFKRDNMPANEILQPVPSLAPAFPADAEERR